MSGNDLDYLVNYKSDTLYTVPAVNGRGAYAKLVGDSEHVVGEIDVTSRCKLAVSAFYVGEQANFDTLKILYDQPHRPHHHRPRHLQRKPVARGLRITVETILDYLSAGETAEEILRQHPMLEPEDIPGVPCVCGRQEGWAMSEHRKRTNKLVREGAYVAEVEVTPIDTESDHPWAPYLSLADMEKLDEVRLALRRKDLAGASRIGRIYELVPVAVE